MDMTNEKLADSTASRLRYCNVKAIRSGTIVKVKASQEEFNKIYNIHSQDNQLSEIRLVRI